MTVGNHPGVMYGHGDPHNPQFNKVIITSPSAPPQGREPQTTGALITAIITTLCCCFLLGVIAIVFAVSAKNDADSGYYEKARKQVRTANILSIVGIVLGAISLVIVIVVMVTAASTACSYSSYYC